MANAALFSSTLKKDRRSASLQAYGTVPDLTYYIVAFLPSHQSVLSAVADLPPRLGLSCVCVVLLFFVVSSRAS